MDYRIVDVFAESPLAGNPLAVFHGDHLSDENQQAVAREMNLSETTFIGDELEDGIWPVRIFTPREELPFAGHPTLGTAFVIRRERAPERTTITLRLAAGDVPVRFDDGGFAWLLAPPVTLGARLDAGAAARVLSLGEEDLDPEFPPQVLEVGPAMSFVPLRSRAALRRACVSADRAQELEAAGAPGMVYAFSRETDDPANQIKVRLFAPLSGIAEDPATGSAAACLGEYVRSHGYVGETPEEFRVEQGAEIQRPSLLRVRTRPEIQVGGRILPVARGTMHALG
ncbi:MAG: PhzF family phenazine biosynthesis protein [Myxococcota bacterium]|nr:PhzF family phenazine biosynthesis protein [Myxococcota bacterium]